ncbi:MAG: N-acyl homoserine lactonase family protein [Bacteroidota bacterium]
MQNNKELSLRFILFTCFYALMATVAVGQEIKYEIYALKFGERTNKIPVADAAVGATGTDSLNVCFMYWLLKGNNGRNILVDAGFTGDADINPKYISFSPPDKMLEKINMKSADITDIIITHPHWDHIGGIDLYPDAMVWMQKDDYDYFVADAWQHDGNSKGFNKKDVVKIVQRNLDEKLTLIKGDDIEIIPGIKVFIGGKHTFESQFVLVGSGDDKVIIASDNSWFYYNLEHLLPIPVTHDAKAYMQNLARMKSMVTNPDYIIPGHDPLVFSKFSSVAEGVVQIKN